MFGGKMGDIMSLMKNAKNIEKMMKQAQDELQHIRITGEAGAGAVTVETDARHTIHSITVDDSVYNESKEVTLDLIIAAINHANKQAEEIAQSKMMNPGDLFGSMMNDTEEKD
jgi:nucleoid-associated protein EbfC